MDDDPTEESACQTQEDEGPRGEEEVKLIETTINETSQELQRVVSLGGEDTERGVEDAPAPTVISSSPSSSSCQPEENDDKMPVSLEEEEETMRPESDQAPPLPPLQVMMTSSVNNVTDPAVVSNSPITITTNHVEEEVEEKEEDSENGNVPSTENSSLVATTTDDDMLIPYEPEENNPTGTVYEPTSEEVPELNDEDLLEEFDTYHTPPLETFTTSKEVEEEEEISYGSSDLFKEVKFAICEDVSELDKIKKVLVAHGAKFLNYLSDSATHLIADNPEHLNVSEAIDIYEKPVVTSQWVWLSLRAQRVLPLEPFSPLGDRLFSRVVVCPSGLPLADRQRIWSMVTYFGGRFVTRLDPRHTTHLVTTRTSGAKYDSVPFNSTTVKVVTPDWVVDSVKQKKLCDESRYHPRLLVTYHGGAKSKPAPATTSSTSSATNSGNSSSTQVESDEPVEKTSRTKSVTMSISTDAVVVTARKSDPVPVSESPTYQPVPHQQSLLQKPLQLRPLGGRMVNRAPPPQGPNVHLQARQPRPGTPRAPRNTAPRMPSQMVRPPSQNEMPNLPVSVSAPSTQPTSVKAQSQPQQTTVAPPQYQQSPMPPGQHFHPNQPIPSTPPVQAGPQGHPQQQQQQPRQVYLTPQQQVVYHPNQYQARQFIRQRPPVPGQMPQQLSPQQQQMYRQQYQQLQQQRARQPVPVTMQAQFQRPSGPVVSQQTQPPTAGQMQSPQMYQARPPNQISPQQMQRMQQQGMPQNQYQMQQPMSEGQMNAQQMQQFQQQQPSPRLVRFQGQEMPKVVPPQMIAQQQLPQQAQAYPQPNQMRPVMAQQQQQPQQVAMMQPQMMQQANGPRMMMRAMHPVQQQQYQQQQQQPQPQMMPEGQKMSPVVGQPQQTHPGVMNRPQGPMQYPMQPRQRWPPSEHYPNQSVNQANQVPPNQIAPPPQQQQQQQFRMMQQSVGANQMSIQQQQAWIRQQQQMNRFHMQQQGQMVRLQHRPNGFSMMQHSPMMGPQQVSPHDPKVRPNVSSSATSGDPGTVPETPVSSQAAQTGPPSSAHLSTTLIKVPTGGPNGSTILVSTNAPVYQVAPGKSPTPGAAQASPGLTHSSPSSSGTSTPTTVPATTAVTAASTTGPLAVNEKTKTALANLLTTRLHLQQQSNGAQQLPNGQSGASVSASATGGQSTKPAPVRPTTSVAFHHEIQNPPVATVPPAPVLGGPELVSPTVPSHHPVPYSPHPQSHAHVHSMPHPHPHPPPHPISHPGQQVYPRGPMPTPQHQPPYPSHVAHPHPPGQMVTHPAVHHQPMIPSNKVQPPPVQQPPSVTQSSQYPVHSQISPYPAMSQPPMPVQPTPPPAKPMIRFFGHDQGPIDKEFCLVGCVFYIAPSYTESPSTGQLVAGWRRRIELFGGRVVDQYQPEVTHLLTEHMQGPLPKQALLDGKRCVSVFWLDDILSNHRVLPPWRIYHLPVAYNHSGPCGHHIISITNFEKDERAIIRHLIVRTGAKYTNYLTSRNTILICKKLEGVKYQKALQWRIPVVNLLWLQDVLFGHQDALQLSTLARKYKLFDQSSPTVTAGSRGEMANTQITNKDCFRLDYSGVAVLMNPWRVPIKFDSAEQDRLRKQKEENEQKAKAKKEAESKAQGVGEESNATKESNDGSNEKNDSSEGKTGSNESSEVNSNNETIKSTENGNQPETNHIGESTDVKNDNCESNDSKTEESEAKSSDTSDMKDDSNPEMGKVAEKSKLENGPITNGPTDSNSDHSFSMNDSNDLTTNDSSNNSTLDGVTTPVASGRKRSFEEAMRDQSVVPMMNGVLENDEEESSQRPSKKAKVDEEVVVKMEMDETGSDGGGEEMRNARISFELDDKNQSPPHEENSATNDSFASHPPVSMTNGDHNESFTNDSLSVPADDVAFKVPFDVKCTVDVLLTGIAPKERDRLEEMIVSLGGHVVRDPIQPISHLVLSSTAQLVTGKLPINFFCAFARAQFVLTTRWLEESGRAGRFLPEADFTLQDPQAEQCYHLDLKRSLSTRSVDLFRGMVFLLTRSLVPSPQVLAKIIEANGGTAVIKLFPTKRQLADLAARQLKFLVISCFNDLHTCDYFFDQNIDVLSHTFILDAIIKQQLDYKSFILRRHETR